MSLCELITTPVVTIKNNEVFANSRDVAAYFGKSHAHVLRDIRDTLRPNLDAKEFNKMFLHVKVETKVGFGSRYDDAEDMIKEGFTLLAMRFTGKKARSCAARHRR
ncbi:Rha family transcriptional regulator [Thalassospira profundimaris]|uniref:Rha family transcriptional regulator n=1 Tax=Thalassospira profundimaris TaxID=502049 RepID=UPI000DEDAFE0|nr:Rha family transcriptional regulator [Thalassospira profundimaris]